MRTLSSALERPSRTLERPNTRPNLHIIDSPGRLFLRRFGKLRFSSIEKRDLIKSWFVISLAFSIAMAGLNFNSTFAILMIVSAITVGLGFLLHELAHKAVAVHFGLWAEYRSFDTMLLLSLFASFFGVLFAAPGAVYITSKGNQKNYQENYPENFQENQQDLPHPADIIISVDKNGKISSAGPLTNFVLSTLFLGLALAVPLISQVALWGAQINAWLGLFNMIPILNFDGSKIWPWNKGVFASMVGIGVGLMIAISAM